MVETLDLQDEIGTLGATNILVPEPKLDTVSEKESEKNINTDIKKPMDSTPISELMQEPMMQQEPVMQQPVMQQPVMQQPVMQQPVMQQPAAPQQQPMKPKNMMNLTDEQMDALIAGAAAMVMFSDAAQERLAPIVPNFMAESGRSVTGTLVTGLLVAFVFFFVRQFMNKN